MIKIEYNERFGMYVLNNSENNALRWRGWQNFEVLLCSERTITFVPRTTWSKDKYKRPSRIAMYLNDVKSSIDYIVGLYDCLGKK